MFLNFVLLLFASIINYYKFHYSISISSTLIESIIGTDPGEIAELFNLSILLWLIVSVLLPIIIIILIAKLRIEKSNKKNIFGFIVFIILISGSFALLPKNTYKPVYISNSLCSFMPFNYILAIKNHWLINKNRQSRENITNYYKFSESNLDNLNIVLVIGESARFDRFGINGYERNTTPYLSKTTNLITYNKVSSLATNTAVGVQQIMQMDEKQNLSSFIQVFNQVGFQTHWFSNQSARYEVINDIIRETNHHLFSDDIRTKKTGNNYDMDLMPYIQLALPKNKLNLVVLHTMGSHRLYDLRSPPNFKNFIPTCIQDELYYSMNECIDQKKLDNSYDNSILYTDYFLSEIIQLLQRSNSIMIYISDHGESLGENGIYAHATPLDIAPKEQTHIPLLIWASDKFLSQTKNQALFENMKKNSSKEIDQSYIFHSILDCVGIKSEAIDLTKSLCRVRK